MSKNRLTSRKLWITLLAVIVSVSLDATGVVNFGILLTPGLVVIVITYLVAQGYVDGKRSSGDLGAASQRAAKAITDFGIAYEKAAKTPEWIGPSCDQVVDCNAPMPHLHTPGEALKDPYCDQIDCTLMEPHQHSPAGDISIEYVR